MTGTKPNRREPPTPRNADMAPPDLRFLRTVFAELTGEKPGPSPAPRRAEAGTNPPPVVGTRPKCLK